MGLHVKKGLRWKDGIIPYVFDDKKTFSPDAKLVILACMGVWQELVNAGTASGTKKPESSSATSATSATSAISIESTRPTEFIRFKPRSGEVPYLLIQSTNGGNSGTIGTRDVKGETGLLTISPDTHLHVVPHELGHVLGLYHENERNVIFLENAPPYDPSKGPRLYIGKYKLDKNGNRTDELDGIADLYLSKIKNELARKEREEVGPYDLESIMHYPPAGTWQWNCSKEQRAAYFRTKTEELRVTQNYPTLEEVKTGWAPSEGDLAAVRHLYAR